MIDREPFMNDGCGNVPKVAPRYPRAFESLWNEEKTFLCDKIMPDGKGGGGNTPLSFGWSSSPFSVQEAMNRSRDKYLKAQKWLDSKVLEDTKPFLPSVLFSLKIPCFDVDRAIFSPPATIVYWSDGTKTVVKCDPDDTYSKETGVALCFMKKALGNKGNYNQVLKQLVEQD